MVRTIIGHYSIMTRKNVWLWIDPTRRCNLSCSLCYTRDSHADEDLSIENFKRMLEILQSDSGINIQHVTFNWRGEPLMNREFVPMMKLLAECRRTFPVQFHTNAMLLSPTVCSSLLDIDGDYTICVSVDGGTAVSHDRNRGAGTFAKAVKGARRLISSRGDRRNPRILLYQLDLREDPNNYDEEFLDLAHSVDDWLKVAPVVPSGDAALLARSPITQGGSSAVLDWPDLPPAAPVPAGPCFWVGNAMCIAPNGDVSVCLLSHRPDGILGNIFSDPACEIMERTAHRRRRISTCGRQSDAHCKVCRKVEGDGIVASA